MRRALWPIPHARSGGEMMSVRVSFDGRQRVRLDERGDWDPVIGEHHRGESVSAVGEERSP